jgi:hypothetical protein
MEMKATEVSGIILNISSIIWAWYNVPVGDEILDTYSSHPWCG